MVFNPISHLNLGISFYIITPGKEIIEAVFVELVNDRY